MKFNSIDFESGPAPSTLSQCLLTKDSNLAITLLETNLIPTLSFRAPNWALKEIFGTAYFSNLNSTRVKIE